MMPNRIRIPRSSLTAQRSASLPPTSVCLAQRVQGCPYSTSVSCFFEGERISCNLRIYETYATTIKRTSENPLKAKFGELYPSTVLGESDGFVGFR